MAKEDRSPQLVGKMLDVFALSRQSFQKDGGLTFSDVLHDAVKAFGPHGVEADGGHAQQVGGARVEVFGIVEIEPASTQQASHEKKVVIFAP